MEAALLHAVLQNTASAGPSMHHLETIASLLVQEFSDVFVLAKRLVTPAYNSGIAAEGPEPLGQDLVVPVAHFQVSKHSWTMRVETPGCHMWAQSIGAIQSALVPAGNGG